MGRIGQRVITQEVHDKALERAKRKPPQIEELTGWGVPYEYREDREINSGSWVLIKCRIPVSAEIRPRTYGIYWAIPATTPGDVLNRDDRQKVKVYTPEECCLLNYEYSVISEEKLQEYRELGWELHEMKVRKEEDPMTIELLEKGRSLCEEDREVIMALMLDGLTETQACEEFFLATHTDDSKIGYYYFPREEILNDIINVFGENGIPG